MKKNRFLGIVIAIMLAFLVTVSVTQAIAGQTVNTETGGNNANIGEPEEVSPTGDNPPIDLNTNAVPNDPYLIRTGSWPFGSAAAIVADEARDLILLGSGGAVSILDVSDPLTPILVSDAVHTQGFVEDLFYDPTNQYLFIAIGRSGMEIWNLQDPTNPQYMSTGKAYYAGVEVPIVGVAVSGDMAYVASNWGWLHWIDVSDPYHPFHAGGEAERLRAKEVFIDGNFVYYVGDTGSNLIFGDLSKYQIQPDGSLSFVTGRNFGLCLSFYASGGVGYLGCGAFYTIDLSDPSLATFDNIGVGSTGTVVSGTHAYLASGNSGLHAIDITTPTNITETGVYDSPGWANDTALLSGNYVYLADDHAGLRVIDISNPMTLTEVGSYDTFGWLHTAAIQGDYAYVTSFSDALAVIDISQPATPTLIGHFDTPTSTYDVAVEGNFAYVADVFYGLAIVDISNPMTPTEVGLFSGIDAFRVDVEGDYAYVIHAIANQPDWLYVVDVSNPFSPTEVSAMQMQDFYIWRVVARGDYLYMAHDDLGLRIFDVSNPASPTEVGFYSAPDVHDVEIQGQYAYVASSGVGIGFLIVDISDPENPSLVGSYNPTGFEPFQVAVSGGYAYATRWDDLYLLDISDPTNPFELEEVGLPLDVSGLTAAGSYVYAADGDAGLLIYHNILSTYNATLGPDSTQESLPGTQVSHTFTLDNLGLSDQYTLSVDGGMWPTTLLNPEIITVEMGTSYFITVTVDVPHMLPGNLGGPDLFTLSATSVNTPSMILTTTGTTVAVVHPDPSLLPSYQEQVVPAGTLVTYPVTITNSGDYTDTFNVALASEWPITATIPFTGPLAVDENVLITLTVQVPLSTTYNEQDTAIITITSAWDSSAVAVAQAKTMVPLESFYGVELSGDAALTGTVGTIVSYTLGITNIGNVTDTFGLVISGNEWIVYAPSIVGPLAAGAGVDVVIEVIIDPEAVTGDIDVAMVTVTSTGDPTLSADAILTTIAQSRYFLIYLPLLGKP